MSKAFILNDYLNDLISEDGALFCGEEAQQIAPAICSYIESFIANGDFVAVGLDTHYENDLYHPETALFPPHNIKGTKGHQLYGIVGELVAQKQKTNPAQIIVFEKSRYSAFVGTPLDIWLRSRKADDLTVAGVCTDMCVLHTVIEAYGRGYKITVPRATCFSPDKEAAAFALAHMENTMAVKVI